MGALPLGATQAMMLFVSSIYSLFLAASVPAANAPSRPVARVGEDAVRHFATHVVRPRFPAASLRQRRNGVAVAQLEIDERGVLERVVTLQAPDHAIAIAVEQAVRQWTFSPFMADAQPRLFIGKATFYFLAKGNRGVVLDAAEAPYMGSWPATK